MSQLLKYKMNILGHLEIMHIPSNDTLAHSTSVIFPVRCHYCRRKRGYHALHISAFIHAFAPQRRAQLHPYQLQPGIWSNKNANLLPLGPFLALLRYFALAWAFSWVYGGNLFSSVSAFWLFVSEQCFVRVFPRWLCAGGSIKWWRQLSVLFFNTRVPFFCISFCFQHFCLLLYRNT